MTCFTRIALVSALVAVSALTAYPQAAPKPEPRRAADAATAPENANMPARGIKREGQLTTWAKTRKNIQLVFMGDSITEFFDRGIWGKVYGKYDPYNCGFMGENTEHLLGHVRNGLLDGLDPQKVKAVVVLIGTNNLGHLPGEKPEWVAAGITAVVESVHQKLPDTKVLVMGVFPRGRVKNDPIRAKIVAVNQILRKLDDGRKIRYLDIGAKFVAEDGSIPEDLMADNLHPTAKGYELWADSMQPLLNEMLGVPAAPPAKVWPEPAAAFELPADDDSIICNHVAPKGVAPPDVRCKNAVTAGEILLFSRGAKLVIDLPVQNDRPAAIPADCTVTLMDRQGTTLRTQSRPLTLATGTATNFSYALDTADLKYGVYSLMLKVTADGKPLTDREYYFGVISGTAIPKAAAGEFLYGLDPNYGVVTAKPAESAQDGKKARQGQQDLLGWIDAMGVDIVRCAGFWIAPGKNTLEAPVADFDVIHNQHKVEVMGMMSPLNPNPKAPDGFLEDDVQKWSAKAEETARLMSEITYWELGNEPDLGYPDMDRYVQTYEKTYQAIKKGNPKAQIMNGAITFHGDAGPKNSLRLIELVKPEFIDIFAFHAHGPGSEHEKRVYELTHQAAVQFGKGDKPLADTESGMFVGSRQQEEMQAWMVIKKQAYAQAVGLKFLMTFRLHAFRSERGWGLLRSDTEPQPAILAYRTMTEHLKGLPFQKKLELTQEYAEGYGFAQAGGSRRACVLWSNQPAFYNVYLKVAGAAKQANRLRLMDMYGNVSPAEISDDGVVRVEVTQTPVYLLWDAAEPQMQVAVVKSMLRTPDMATVIPDGKSELPIRLEVPAGAELAEAILTATISAAGQAVITPDKMTFQHIPPKTSTPITFAIQWNPQQQGLVWPERWTVYTDVAESDVDLATATAIPEAIKNVLGRQVLAVNGTIPLLRPGELPHEKRPGFVFGMVQSDRDQVVRVGCVADWWMEFRLNGAVVGSTLQTGNKFLTVTERQVDLPLKKGDNLLAFKILSGKGGWNLQLASPAELPALLDPRKAGNCVDLTLTTPGGKILARERLALQPVRRIAALGDLKWGDALERWQKIPADAALGSAQVTNLFEKQQDRSKWWQGEPDLSATVWMRCDSQRLYLLVWVLDDRDVTGTAPEKMGDFDSLRVGVSRDGRYKDEYTVGRIAGKTVLYREVSSLTRPVEQIESSPEISAEVRRQDKGTFYAVSLDRTLAGDGLFRFNFLVNDNDEGVRKQYLEFSGGMAAGNPSAWPQFILTAPAHGGEGK